MDHVVVVVVAATDAVGAAAVAAPTKVANATAAANVVFVQIDVIEGRNLNGFGGETAGEGKS